MVQAGPLIELAGTTSTDRSGNVLYPRDAGSQTRVILEKMLEKLSETGASAQHIVRTRIYTTDISRWEEIGNAHAELLGMHPPASAMVEISRLIHPDMLVEIELTAWMDLSDSPAETTATHGEG